MRDAVQFGPFLIVNGTRAKTSGNGGWGINPRTVLAQRKDGIVLFLVIDGRRLTMPGASIKDLIEIRVKRTSIEETLNFFSDLYDSVFNTVIAIGKKYNQRNIAEDSLFTDTALYMAMGSSSTFARTAIYLWPWFSRILQGENLRWLGPYA